MMNRKKLLIRIISIIFFIFTLNLIAMKLYWYYSIWWLDMPMHILGGFWIGLVFFWYFRFEKLSFVSVSKIILGVLVIAIGWEVFESLLDKTITQNPFNALDTFSDLCFGIAGGLLSVFYFFKRVMFRKQNKV